MRLIHLLTTLYVYTAVSERRHSGGHADVHRGESAHPHENEHEHYEDVHEDMRRDSNRDEYVNAHSHQDSCIDAEKRVAALQSALEESDYALSDIKNKYDVQNEKISSLNSEIDIIMQEKAECQAHISATQNEKCEDEHLRTIIEAQNNEMLRLKEEKSDCQRQISSSDNAKDEDIRKLTKAFNDIEDKLQKKEKDIQSLTIEKDSYTQDIKDKDIHTQKLEDKLRELKLSSEQKKDHKFDYHTLIHPWIELLMFYHNIQKFYFDHMYDSLRKLSPNVHGYYLDMKSLFLQHIEPLKESLMPTYTQVTNNIVKNYYMATKYYKTYLKDNVERGIVTIKNFTERKFKAIVNNLHFVFDMILHPILTNNKQDFHMTDTDVQDTVKHVRSHYDKLGNKVEMAAVFILFIMTAYHQIRIIKKILFHILSFIGSVLSFVFCCSLCNRSKEKNNKDKKDKKEKDTKQKKDSNKDINKNKINDMEKKNVKDNAFRPANKGADGVQKKRM